jgi:hypothetical protein
VKTLARFLPCVTLCVAATVYAGEKINFSGSYTLTRHENSEKTSKETVKILTVVQSENSIGITEVEEGHTNTYQYPLDGGEGVYVSPGGIKGTCKGQLKKNYLVLDSLVTTRPQSNGPAVQIHTKQKWELSADLKTLKIRFDIDSPQSPINLLDPWTEIYTRNQ